MPDVPPLPRQSKKLPDPPSDEEVHRNADLLFQVVSRRYEKKEPSR